MTPAEKALYLQRIGYQKNVPTTIDLALLEQLHKLHVLHVPFENVDVHSQEGISLDSTHLFNKIVMNKRGGYCFELNKLFSSLLASLGFPLQRYLGRVWRTTDMKNSAVPSRSHQVTVVTLEGKRYLADVGFGNSPLYPIDIDQEGEVTQHAHRYRHRLDQRFGHLLEYWQQGEWYTMYSFTEEECYDVDYQVANFYTSRHPDSPFIHWVICTLPTEEGRKTLSDKEFIVTTNNQIHKQTVNSLAEYLVLLQQHFAITLPPNRTLPIYPTESTPT